MVSMERVKYLHDTAEMSIRQIAKECHVSRKKVAKLLRGSDVRVGRKRPTQLDKYRSLIISWFKEYPHIKGKQIYKWLQERGFELSYTRMIKYIRPLRPEKIEQIYHELTFLPAEEGQVDWFFVTDETLGKICCFAIVLSYSRYMFVHAFERSSFEFFIEGHLMAFSELGGLPHNLRYDNLRSVVLKRRPDIEYNPAFLEFARYYGLGIRVCNPAAGNEKGRVERAIRTIKESFFAKPEKYHTIKALNIAMHAWVLEKNQTVHRSINQKPVDLFKEEKLKPLPAILWKNMVVQPPARTTKTGLMIFDTNAYSVPDYLVGKSLAVHASTGEINIYDANKCIAKHPRSFKRNQKIINPIHRSFSKLSTEAKMDRIYCAIKNMDGQIGTFLEGNEKIGEDPRRTAYEIFKLLRNNSRGLIISAIRETLFQKSPKIKTLLSFFTPSCAENSEEVLPQRAELLNITYNPRSLEAYDEHR